MLLCDEGTCSPVLNHLEPPPPVSPPANLKEGESFLLGLLGKDGTF